MLPPLHAGQREVAAHPARFRVLAAGRRWGKTLLGVWLVVAEALNRGRAWWVAPTYKMGLIGWRSIAKLARQVPGTEIRVSDRYIRFPGGGEVYVRSADNPDSLRGEGLNLVVLDECAFTREEAWTNALRPALSERAGRALFISTPKGRNWFWRLYQRGLEDGKVWASFHFPTASSPYVSADEIEEARRSLPERVFRQEYLAEFVDDAGGVFRKVIEAATAQERDEPTPGHEYIFGIDWGKYEDFTVIVILDATERAVVKIDRFNQVDYALQRARLFVLYETFQPRVIIAERNAMGEPLVEELQRAGLPVQPFTTTAASKTAAIEALALALERGDLRILPDPVLVGELQAYEAQRLPSGMLRYGAPAGMHDDTVVALALAWQGVVDSGPLLLWGWE